MTTPAGDDSDWNDLASELGLETKPVPKPYDPAPAGFAAQQTPGEPPPFPAEPWPAEPAEAEMPPDESDLMDAEASDDHDTMIEPLLANEEIAPEDGSTAEGDGTGKRRRRRRRRRKGGPDGGPEGGIEGEAGTEGADGAELNDVDPEAEVEPHVPVETRTTADAIRDLVRNWNVPGWNEVVAGLYRPGGDRA